MLFMLYSSRTIPIKFNIDMRQYFPSILALKDPVDLGLVYLRKQRFCKICFLHLITQYINRDCEALLSVILTKDHETIGPISEHNHSLLASTSVWKNTSNQSLPGQAV